MRGRNAIIMTQQEDGRYVAYIDPMAGMSARAEDVPWDGIPDYPNQDGLHYITDGVALWLADKRKWALFRRASLVTPEWLVANTWARYRGPVPPPPSAR